MAEVDLEANNRTWDTIAEHGEELGVYTDARPPYGCLGLTLKRTIRKHRSESEVFSKKESPDLLISC